MSQSPLVTFSCPSEVTEAAPSDSLGCSPSNGPVDVSVCIVNWNCRELLHACLESLLHRPQGVGLETIVVDNGSMDGAAKMVAAEFPEATLIRNAANRGFARANNQAARLARGRYLFFLNNDTQVPSLALRRLVEFADAHPEAGMVGPRLRNGAGELQYSYRCRPTVSTLLHRTMLLRWTGLFRRAYHRGRRHDAQRDTPRPVEILMGAAMLLPREVFFQCGAWDEGYIFGGEDMDLCTRVGQRHALVYLPEVEITHHGRMSTRQHLDYTATHIPAGFVRYLRVTGTSSIALLAYKLVVSLDAPLQWLAKGVQFLWRRMLGKREKAEKSRLAMRSAGHFLLRGLGPFWRA